MPNITLPELTELAKRKISELQANGYRITGYCFERQVDGTQPQRGFVDFAGFVGWWRPRTVAEAQANAVAKHLIINRYAEEWGTQLTSKGTLAPILHATTKRPTDK